MTPNLQNDNHHLSDLKTPERCVADFCLIPVCNRPLLLLLPLPLPCPNLLCMYRRTWLFYDHYYYYHFFWGLTRVLLPMDNRR